MKNRKIILAAVIAIIGMSALAVWAGSNLFVGKATFTPTTDLKWYESPIPGGVKISPVYGDITKGEHLTYVRFPAGTKIPTHIHATDYVGVVISGNMRHPVKGKAETDVILPPGSHWSMPANLEHETECLEGMECIALMYQKDHFEFTVSGQKGTK